MLFGSQLGLLRRWLVPKRRWLAVHNVPVIVFCIAILWEWIIFTFWHLFAFQSFLSIFDQDFVHRLFHLSQVGFGGEQRSVSICQSMLNRDITATRCQLINILCLFARIIVLLALCGDLFPIGFNILVHVPSLNSLHFRALLVLAKAHLV